MSASIDTVRTDTTNREADAPDQRKLDVSELDPDRVADYARETDAMLYFERKGGRTYLVAR
ncbi:hypothetical protein [Halorarius halobius]|uniref:hypothetical protein n=1 Tax=Halorarius halobius TaxID=2962671 RepID=UPI0020CBCC31|nr:hypothetical protein [Halorarius halobius]